MVKCSGPASARRRGLIPRISQSSGTRCQGTRQDKPFTNAEWEKRSIFLNFLVSKLPAPVEEDLSKGILEAIDMDSYRVEKKAAMKIQLPDEDAEIEPTPTSGGGYQPEPELDRLSNIIKAFNDQFGSIPWADADRVHVLISRTRQPEEILHRYILPAVVDPAGRP